MAQWYRQGPPQMSRNSWLSDAITVTLHTGSETAVNLDTSVSVSQIVAELATGGGYTAGGVALTSKTAAYLAASAWGYGWGASLAYPTGSLMQTGGYIYRATVGGTSGSAAPTWPTAVGSTVADGTITWMCEGAGSLIWSASTAYPAGYIVRPITGNGYLYRATVAGTSSTAGPTWPTVPGQAVADGGVIWECVGGGVTVYAAANPVWSAASFTAVRYAIISDRTPTGTANQPLLGFTDFGSALSGGGGSFTDQFAAEGCLFETVA